MSDAIENAKRLAAARAVDLVRPGLRLGLGTGSTARHFVDLLGAKVRAGMEVICVPTSEATRAQAQSLGIPLTTLDDTPELDLTVDGADEFDPALNLMKGGGGALQPEFTAYNDDLINFAGVVYTALLSEQECKDALAFFNSPIGKKFIDVQPGVFANMGPAMGEWSKSVSVRMMDRVRAERKKKGHDL